MWKGSSKIGTINVCLPSTFGKEKSMTSRTKYIDGVISGEIRKPYRKHGLSLTKYTWTPAKRCCSILFVHRMHTSIGDDVANRCEMQNKRINIC